QGHTGCAIVEGEKDADRLTKAGVLATTNPMGGGAWRDEYAQQLKTAGIKVVIVFPDNDSTGEKHEASSRSLRSTRTPRASTTRIRTSSGCTSQPRPIRWNSLQGPSASRSTNLMS